MKGFKELNRYRHGANQVVKKHQLAKFQLSNLRLPSPPRDKSLKTLKIFFTFKIVGTYRRSRVVDQKATASVSIFRLTFLEAIMTDQSRLLIT